MRGLRLPTLKPLPSLASANNFLAHNTRLTRTILRRSLPPLRREQSVDSREKIYRNKAETSTGRRDCRDRRSCYGFCGQGGNHDCPHRLHRRRRPGGGVEKSPKAPEPRWPCFHLCTTVNGSDTTGEPGSMRAAGVRLARARRAERTVASFVQPERRRKRVALLGEPQAALIKETQGARSRS
jgi:hypothetical protein